MVQVRFETSAGITHELQGEIGQSVMRVAKNNEVPGILAYCGGNAECGTCHVWVDEEFLEKLEARSDAEEAMLGEVAAERKMNSRLSCQLKLTDDLGGISVTIPETQE